MLAKDVADAPSATLRLHPNLARKIADLQDAYADHPVRGDGTAAASSHIRVRASSVGIIKFSLV
jgi:hypothetical protein